MGKVVSHTIPGLYNGVSQQSPVLRLETQVDEQINAESSLTKGISKRPGTEHLALLTSNAASGAYVHKINRDATEKYIVVFTGQYPDPVEVFKTDGTKCTVQFGHLDADLTFTEDELVKAYIATIASPKTTLKATTIADYTLVVNNTKTTALEEDTVAGTITGTVQDFAKLPIDDPGHSNWNSTKSYKNWSKVRYGDYVYTSLEGTGNLNKQPDISDDYWTKNDLIANTGDLYEVTGDPDNAFDNLYVEYDGEVWNERALPGITYQFDVTTMPHRLVRTGENEFTFADIEWSEREVGDDNSCPAPSFIDNTIQNVVFFKNRLGFLSKDQMVLSKVSEYFKLWRTTAADILDDDPIDTASPSASVSLFGSAIPFDKSLVIFGDQEQFDYGSGDKLLTPTTHSMTTTTRYPTDPQGTPVAAGSNIYFVSPREDYVSIREYFVVPDTLIEDAADITAHCPNYIPNGHIQLEACNSYDTLFAHSDAAEDTLFVYKYYWVGNEKAMSSWSKYTFDGDILGMVVLDTTLYLLTKRGTEVSLEKMALEDHNTENFGFRVHLDRQVSIQGVYDDQTNQTTFTYPYEVSLDEWIEYMPINPETGMVGSGVMSYADNAIRISGDRTAQPYLVGRAYETKIRLSEWYMKDERNQSIIEGRLQIRSITLAFSNTGAFRLDVTPFRRDVLSTTYSSLYSGILVGISTIGEIELMTGEEAFMVMAKSKQTQIEIVNDSYLPSSFQSGSYKGMFVPGSNVV
ncbi:hypothetical protein ACFL6N_07500 [Thermodesulfobacteriota bacterium]